MESSPRARGCLIPDRIDKNKNGVFPACAGVFLLASVGPSFAKSLPRVRGGVSKVALVRCFLVVSSPRARGCFHNRNDFKTDSGVFPACAGVFLCGEWAGAIEDGLPRVRGGVSTLVNQTIDIHESSPRARGCFHNRCLHVNIRIVFPACAGVFLPISIEKTHSTGLPRVRGGVSTRVYTPDGYGMSSPRARGCSEGILEEQDRDNVFPACAGVFLCISFLLP